MNIEQINETTIRINGKLHKLVPINEPLVDAERRYLTEPEDGTTVWITSGDGGAVSCAWSGSGFDRKCLAVGDYFISEAAAARQSRKLAAIQRMKRWQAENAPFTPDWGDADQKKHHVSGWNHEYNRPSVDYVYGTCPNNGLPVFATAEARDRFIEENADDLKIWAGVE